MYFKKRSNLKRLSQNIMPTPSNNRIHYMDLLRSVAIMLVVALHSYQQVPFDLDSRYFMGMGVPIFLCISGALIIPKAGTMGLRQFYGKYAKRLIQFAVLIPICGIITNALVWYCKGEHVSLAEANSTSSHGAFLHIGTFPFIKCFYKSLIEANGIIPEPLTIAQSHTWYLYYIIGLYIAAPFIARLFKTLSTKQCYLFCVLCLLADIPTTLSFIPVLHPFHIGQTFYFILGYIILYRTPVGTPSFLRTLCLVLGCSTIGWNFLYRFTPQLANFEYFRIPLATIALTIFCKDYLRNVTHSIITSLSKCSFGIYLWHFAVLWLCCIFFPMQSCQVHIKFLFYVFCGVMVPWGITLAARRIRILRWLVC